MEVKKKVDHTSVISFWENMLLYFHIFTFILYFNNHKLLDNAIIIFLMEVP